MRLVTMPDLLAVNASSACPCVVPSFGTYSKRRPKWLFTICDPHWVALTVFAVLKNVKPPSAVVGWQLDDNELSPPRAIAV